MKKNNSLVFSISLSQLCCLLSLVLWASPANGQAASDSLQAHSLYKEAVALQNKARFDSSNASLKKAAERYAAGNYWKRVAACYNLISSNYFQLSELDQAEEFARKVLDTLEKHSLSDPALTAKAYNSLGLVATENSNFSEAVRWLDRGLAIVKKNRDNTPADIEGLLLGNLGSVYDEQGDFEKALEYYARGIEALQAAERKSVDEELAKLYNYAGITHGKMGQLNNALQFYELELEINSRLYGQSHPAVAGSYNNIGGIYYRKGDIGEAIVYFKKAASSTELVFGKNHPRTGLLYNNIGACYYEMGNYEQAVAYLEKSAEIKLQTQGANHPDLALTYNNIGGIYTEMQQYGEAIDYLQQSLEIRKEVLGENHPVLANNYRTLGLLYLNREKPGEAIRYFEEGLDLSRRTRGDDHPFVAEALTHLARAHRRQGNLSESLALLREAENLLSPGKKSLYRHPLYAVDVLHEKGKTLFSLYEQQNRIRQLISARDTYMELSGLLDDIQLEFRSEESKLLMGSESHSIYEDAIETSYTLYSETGMRSHLEDIYFYAEKSKSRVILEQLYRQQARRFSGIPDSLLARENNLRKSIGELYRDIAAAGQEVSAESREQLQDSLFTLRRKLNDHLMYLKERYPSYHDFRYRPDITSSREVQSSLKRKGFTLIEYFHGEKALWAVVASPEQLDIVKVPDTSNLEETIYAFNQAISEKQDTTWQRLGYELYRTLIRPVESKLNGTPGKLLIVPDGALNLLPFEALLRGPVTIANSGNYSRLPWLLNRYSISYTASVSLSSVLDERPQRKHSKKLAAFAPVFSFSSTQQVENRGGRWDPLPSTAFEVERISETINNGRSFWASLTGHTPSKVFTNEEATEANFKEESLNRYRYVHLATHAFMTGAEESRAGIAFHPEQSGKEDGILYAEEIYGLRMQNELVVLSACETGRGELVAGEGIIGLSRAFQYAGVESLVVSLWKVEDRSTAQLMISFYDLLQNGTAPYLALREAKKKLISSGQYAHPVYWAPFIFIGN